MPEEDVGKGQQKPEEGAAKPEEKKEMSPLVKKLILAGVILVVLAAEAGVAYFLIQATKQEDPRVLADKRNKEQEAQARMKETTMGMATEPIDVIVNIRGQGEEERYAKVGVQLEFDDTKYPDFLAELERRKPRIKTILIEYLTSMQLEDLMTSAGKMKFRKAIRRDVNKTLPKDVGTIRDVFLSEFIIQ